jgi:hypothetical protein
MEGPDSGMSYRDSLIVGPDSEIKILKVVIQREEIVTRILVTSALFPVSRPVSTAADGVSLNHMLPALLH